MHVYGVTNEDFGRYSVACRKHAANNPNAYFYERPDHAGRPSEFPLDRRAGAAAARLLPGKRRRSRDGHNQPRTRARPAPATGADRGGGAKYRCSGAISYPTTTTKTSPGMPEIGAIGRQLWRDSGLRPKDIQAAMLYDHFSPIVFLHLEEFGFCGRGEARDFIADGNIEAGREACRSTRMADCSVKPIFTASTISTKRCANCAARRSTRSQARSISWSAPE